MATDTPQVGDMVKVWKWVMYHTYNAQGPIEEIQTDRTGQTSVKVDNDWWLATNDLENRYEPIPDDQQ